MKLEGYKKVNRIKQFNFQINRVLTYGKEACDEELVIKNLSDVHTLEEWYEAWTKLSAIAIDSNKYMHAAYYDRMAEFFLKQSDSRKHALYDKCIEEYHKAFEQAGIEYKAYEVPFEKGFLKCIRMTPENYKQTVLVCGGYDSFIEEFVLQVRSFVQEGFDVILMEGPGQGDCVWQKIYFKESFEHPVASVLDYFGVSSCTMVGISWGGFFALRAAAFEKKIKHVVAYDAMDDGLEVMTHIFPDFICWYVRKLIKNGNETKLIRLLTKISKKNVLADWMLSQGQFITGTDSIPAMYKSISKHNLRSVYEKIDQDVLLLAGEKDHYIPMCQFKRCKEKIKNAKSMTSRCFTREEGGEQHCQLGNHGIAVDAMLDWIERIS